MRLWLLCALLAMATGCAHKPQPDVVRLTVSAIPETDVHSYQKGSDGQQVPCWPDVPLDITWKREGDTYVSEQGGELAPTGIDSLRAELRSIPDGEGDLLAGLGVTQERVDLFHKEVTERTGHLSPEQGADLLSLEAIGQRAKERMAAPETAEIDHPSCMIKLEVGGAEPFTLTSTGPTRYGSLPWFVQEGGRKRVLSSVRVSRDLATLLKYTLLGVKPGPVLLGAEHMWEGIFWHNAVLKPEEWARFNELYLKRMEGYPSDFQVSVTRWRTPKADITVTPPDGPIARLYALVELDEGWVEFDWDFAREVYEDTLAELDKQPWLSEWVQAAPERTLVLELEPFTESTEASYSEKRAPLHRLVLYEKDQPRGVVELYQKGEKCTVVEAGQLTSQGTARPVEPPSSPHWFDTLYVSQRGTDDNKHNCAEVKNGYPYPYDLPALTR